MFNTSTITRAIARIVHGALIHSVQSDLNAAQHLRHSSVESDLESDLEADVDADESLTSSITAGDTLLEIAEGILPPYPAGIPLSSSSIGSDQSSSNEQQTRERLLAATVSVGAETTTETLDAENANNNVNDRELAEQLLLCSCMIAEKDTETIKFPFYKCNVIRANSFNEWPVSSMNDTSQIAWTGFFYSGVRDVAICFACGLALEHWESNDTAVNPMREHEYWNPRCSWLRRYAGRYGRYRNDDHARASDDVSRCDERYAHDEYYSTCHGDRNENGDQGQQQQQQQQQSTTYVPHTQLAARDNSLHAITTCIAWRPLLERLQDESNALQRELKFIISFVQEFNAVNNLASNSINVRNKLIYLAHTLIESMHYVRNEPSATTATTITSSSSSMESSSDDPSSESVRIAIHPPPPIPPEPTETTFERLCQRLSDTLDMFDFNRRQCQRTRNTLRPGDTVDELREESIRLASSNNNSGNLDHSDHSLECLVCMDRARSVLFIPCRHLVTCTTCSTKLTICPVCRCTIWSDFTVRL